MRSKSKIRLIVLLLATSIPASFFIACGPDSKETTDGDTSEVMAPLKMNFTIPEQKLSVGGNFPLHLTWSGKEVPRAVGKIEASGVISLTDMPDLAWDDVKPGEELKGRGEFRITDTGMGQIGVQISALDESGNTLWSPRETIYFLATQKGVYTNTTSPMLLEIEHLRRLRDSGAITEREYSERVDSILGSGAKVEVEVDTSE